jgi:hypothetical protein
VIDSDITDRCLRHSQVLVNKLSKPAESPEELRKTVWHHDELRNNLYNARSLWTVLSQVHPSAQVRVVSQLNLDRLDQFSASLESDQTLYSRLDDCIAVNSERNFLSEEECKVASQIRPKIVHRSGHVLSSAERAQSVKLELEIENVEAEFSRQLSSQSSGFARSGRSVKFSNTARMNASQFQLVTVLLKLLKLRQDLAILYGFASYSELHLHNKVLSSPTEVTKFLDQFLNQSVLQQQTNKKILSSNAAPVYPSSDVSLAAFLTVFQEICQNDFGLNFSMGSSSQSNSSASMIHLRFSDIFSDCAFGSVYIDFSSETTIDTPSLTVALQTWRKIPFYNSVSERFGAQLPIAFIRLKLLNHNRLSFAEIRTLFHELGHSLHIICSDTQLHSLSGVNGHSAEFNEIPSLFMELLGHDFVSRRLGLQCLPAGPSEKAVTLLFSKIDLFLHNFPQVIKHLGLTGHAIEKFVFCRFERCY